LFNPDEVEIVLEIGNGRENVDMGIATIVVRRNTPSLVEIIDFDITVEQLENGEATIEYFLKVLNANVR